MSQKLDQYFKNCLYFTSGKLYREVEKRAVASFSTLNISPSHAFILMALHEAKDYTLTPSDLATVLNLDKSTITRLLHLLENSQYIVREKSGRNVLITISQNGSALIPQIHDCWKNLYDSYCHFWGKSKSNAINKTIFDFLNS